MNEKTVPYTTNQIQPQNDKVPEDQATPPARALQIYADRADVRELSERITQMLPSMKALGNPGALALAQVSISMGLNPFIGELWAIPKKGGGFSLMCGIKGLRRAARNQAAKDDGMYVIAFRKVTVEEAAGLRINDGDIIRACDLVVDGRKARRFHEFTGAIPRFTGIGVYREGEKTMMNPVQVARKRAEADALKQAFDLPIGLEQEGEQLSEDQGYAWGSDPATRGRHKLLKGDDQLPRRPVHAPPPPTRPGSQLFKDLGPPPPEPWGVTPPPTKHWTQSPATLDEFSNWCHQERAMDWRSIQIALGSALPKQWPDSIDDCKLTIDAWIADQLIDTQDDDDAAADAQQVMDL